MFYGVNLKTGLFLHKNRNWCTFPFALSCETESEITEFIASGVLPASTIENPAVQKCFDCKDTVLASTCKINLCVDCQPITSVRLK